MIQSGKGGGLNLVGGGNTGMQASRMDAVTKITWVAGISFFLLGVLAAIAFADAGPKIDSSQSKDPLSFPVENNIDTENSARSANQNNPDNSPGSEKK